MDTKEKEEEENKDEEEERRGGIGRAGNSLIRSLLIRSFRSTQMSDCERFAQIAQDK